MGVYFKLQVGCSDKGHLSKNIPTSECIEVCWFALKAKALTPLLVLLKACLSKFKAQNSKPQGLSTLLDQSEACLMKGASSTLS